MPILLKPHAMRCKLVLLLFLTTTSAKLATTSAESAAWAQQSAPWPLDTSSAITVEATDLEQKVEEKLQTARDNDSRDLTKQAAADYEAAIKLAESAHEAGHELLVKTLTAYAEYAYSREFYTKSAELLVRCSKIAPLDHRERIVLAQSLYASGHTKSALLHFQEIFDNDLANSYSDMHIRDYVIDELEALVDLYLKHGDNKKAAELRTQKIHRLALILAPEEHSAASDIERRLESCIADTYIRAHKPQYAIAVRSRYLREAQLSCGRLNPRTCEIRLSLAEAYLANRQPQPAEKLYTDLVKQFQNTPDEANALVHAANFYWETQKLDAAEKALRRAVALRKKTYNPQSRMVLLLEGNLALVLENKGLQKEADRLNLRYARQEYKCGRIDSEVLFYYLQGAGRTSEAMSLCQKEIAKIDQRPPQSKDLDARGRPAEYQLNFWLDELASLYCDAGEFAKALALLERQFRVCNPERVSPERLAKVYLKLGEVARAEAVYREHVRLVEKVTSGNSQAAANGEIIWRGDALVNSSVAEAKNDLAKFYYDRGRYEDAESVLLETLQMLYQNREEATTRAIIIQGNLAQIYAKQGKVSEATALLSKLLLEQLGDTSKATGHDPVSGFKTNGDAFGSGILHPNEYLNDSHKARIDPEFSKGLRSSKVDCSKSIKHFFDSENNMLSQEQEIPMLDWCSCLDIDKSALPVPTLFALAKLYSADGQEKKARAARSSALLKIEESLHYTGAGLPGPLYYSESMIKRLPKSPRTKRLLTALQKYDRDE